MSRLSYDAIHAAGPCDCRTIEPADRNGQPRTFVEVIDHEALGYRAWGTPAGDFLAQQMERLAQLIRWTRATTPAEYTDRIDVAEAALREHWYELGKAHGREQLEQELDDIRNYGSACPPLAVQQIRRPTGTAPIDIPF